MWSSVSPARSEHCPHCAGGWYPWHFGHTLWLFYTSSVLLTMLLECCLGLLAKWCIILAHMSHQLLRKIRNRLQVSLLLLTARTFCTAEVPCLDVFSPAIPQHMPIFFSATEREEMSVFIRASRCVNTVKIHERTF